MNEMTLGIVQIRSAPVRVILAIVVGVLFTQKASDSYDFRMSCIRFNTSAQRSQNAELAGSVTRSDDPVAQFLSPAVTASKIARLREMAKSPNPKIRASVAASYHAPVEVYEALAADSDPEVRSWIARNEHVPCDILRSLVNDPDEQVRSFLAVNFYVPADTMMTLADDSSWQVRALVDWKAKLAVSA